MFRENIFEFTEMGTLFVPKNGGLYDYVFEMLPDMGMELESWMGKKEADGFKQDGLEIVLARGEDIPQRTDELICNQRSAFGLTGDDLFDEYMLSQTLDGNISPLIVLNTYDWFDENAKYNRPALCLMNKTGNFEDIPKNAKVAVNKKYENTSKVYLSKSYRLKNLDLRIESYNGDTEKTVADGTNNCCIEIVYSGKTVEENDLEIVDIVRFSDIVLVGEDSDYLGKVSCQDYRQINRRKSNYKEGSTTTKLLQDRKARRDKIISEAAEVFSAIEGNKKNLPGELADLLYAMNVVMAGEGVSPRDVAYEMQRRL